jgi:hypothetical protein
MYELLNLLFKAVFRLLGIPNPTFNVDTALVLSFLLIYLAAVPAMWLWEGTDWGGRVYGTVFLTVVLAICVLSLRAQIRSKTKT